MKKEIINEIRKTAIDKEGTINSIKSLERERNNFIMRGENKEKLLESLEIADKANLWTEEGRRLIKTEHIILDKLLTIEEDIRRQLNLEIEISYRLALRELILQKASIRDIGNMEIRQLISIFDFWLLRDERLDEELGKLLTEDEIQELVRGKFQYVAIGWSRLGLYNGHEASVIRFLDAKIKKQIEKMSEIIKNIQQQPSQKTEQADTNENYLLKQVMETGGTFIHTSIPSHYSPGGSSGLQDLVHKRMPPRYNIAESAFHLQTHELIQRFGQVYTILRGLGINEAITVMPHMEDIYQDIQVTTKSFLRTKTEVQRKKQGERQVMHRELVNQGLDEPAYSFVYLALDTYNERFYFDYSGRPGQILLAEIILPLPKSVAEAVFARAKQHPIFARKVIEYVALNHIGINQKFWFEGDEYTHNHPLRPPYEQWSKKEGGSKMYIQEMGNEQGFNQSFLHIVE